MLHVTCSMKSLADNFLTCLSDSEVFRGFFFCSWKSERFGIEAMAATKTRASSFSRNVSVRASAQSPGIKCGPNGTFFVSSGIPDLDRILGGGFPLGSLVMVMEDSEAPHHLLLLRNFMSQGLVHHQPLLYASPFADPRGFLGTLPNPALSTDEKSRRPDLEQEKNLRIAWQYKKYFGENQHEHKDSNQQFCNEFDLRKPLEKHFFTEQRVSCFSFKENPLLSSLKERCTTFFAQFPRNDANVISPCRVAIQSLCAPQCEHSNMEWDTLSFLRSLKTMLQSANGVAIVSFPPSLLSASFCKRLQHMSDILLSVRAIPDDDKELAKLLTGYQDMVGFLNIHKVSRMNSQVPVILEATTYSMKLQKRRYLVLECLNQAPVDGSSGSSYDTKSGSCSASSKTSSLEF